MKKLILTSAIWFALISCHNYARESEENQAKSSADSTRIADSMNHINKDSLERITFQKHIHYQIDSIELKLASLDSLSDKKNGAEKKKLTISRNHIKTRIERLKAKEKEAGDIAVDKWVSFKEEIDTAVQNVKTEWNNGE